MGEMHKYFNPGKFVRIIDAIFPYVAVLTVFLFGLGLYFAIFDSPPDSLQGESVRIMYVHVPAASMALGVYSFIALMGIASLVWKNPLSDIIGISAAYIGAAFAAICLITGSLWGKPIWGAWWVWDARLTSMLILFFFYLGYISLYNAYDDKIRAGKIVSIFSIVGFLNVPIVKFSVNWWHTLHQPASIMRSGGVAIDGSMLIPLALMFAAFISFFLLVLTIRVKAELLSRKIERKQMNLV